MLDLRGLETWEVIIPLLGGLLFAWWGVCHVRQFNQRNLHRFNTQQVQVLVKEEEKLDYLCNQTETIKEKIMTSGQHLLGTEGEGEEKGPLDRGESH